MTTRTRSSQSRTSTRPAKPGPRRTPAGHRPSLGHDRADYQERRRQAEAELPQIIRYPHPVREEPPHIGRGARPKTPRKRTTTPDVLLLLGLPVGLTGAVTMLEGPVRGVAAVALLTTADAIARRRSRR